MPLWAWHLLVVEVITAVASLQGFLQEGRGEAWERLVASAQGSFQAKGTFLTVLLI